MHIVICNHNAFYSVVCGGRSKLNRNKNKLGFFSGCYSIIRGSISKDFTPCCWFRYMWHFQCLLVQKNWSPQFPSHFLPATVSLRYSQLKRYQTKPESPLMPYKMGFDWSFLLLRFPWWLKCFPTDLCSKLPVHDGCCRPLQLMRPTQISYFRFRSDWFAFVRAN